MKTLQGRLFIHATNVHSGGGRSLLDALLAAWPSDVVGMVQLDSRMSVREPMNAKINVRLILPTIWRRLGAEWWLFKSVAAADLVVCFGNLPPLLRLRGRVVVFLQNRYLVDAVSLQYFPWKTRIRLEVERRWFAWKVGNARAFIVQTPSMQAVLQSSGLLTNQSVYVLPFVNVSDGYERVPSSQQKSLRTHVFFYVASGEPHKNHRRLVEAWCLLAKEGLRPSLWLTLDATIHGELCAWIGQLQATFDLNLMNLGAQSHQEILRLYTVADALIYPSTFESFGIPLIEARQAGLSILAAELDYVRDLVDAEQVFDPHSAISIARAVKRFIGVEQKPLPLLNAAEFLKTVLEKCE